VKCHPKLHVDIDIDIVAALPKCADNCTGERQGSDVDADECEELQQLTWWSRRRCVNRGCLSLVLRSISVQLEQGSRRPQTPPPVLPPGKFAPVSHVRWPAAGITAHSL